MNSTGSKLGKALSSFMAAAVVLSVSRFAGAEMPVNADGERSLNGEASSFKITEILNSVHLYEMVELTEKITL